MTVLLVFFCGCDIFVSLKFQISYMNRFVLSFLITGVASLSLNAHTGDSLNGKYRTASYFNVGAGFPIADFDPSGKMVTAKLTNHFYLNKDGFAKGLLNLGLAVNWANFSTFRKESDDETVSGYSMSAGIGPVVTFGFTEDFSIDLYQTSGYGFWQLNSKRDSRIHNSLLLQGFTNNNGINFRYKMLVLGFGMTTTYTNVQLGSLANFSDVRIFRESNLLDFLNVGDYANYLTQKTNLSSFQCTIGLRKTF